MQDRVERVTRYIDNVMANTEGTRAEGVYVVSVALKGRAGQQKLEVLVDSDKGIAVEQCAWVSRRILEKLEEDDEPLSEEIAIEVSSPGLGTPLQLPRQYYRHLGKLLHVRYRTPEGAEAEIEGYLQEAQLDGVNGGDSADSVIVLKPKVQGKRPRNAQPLENIRLPLSRIIKAVPEAEL
uniref:Ribosome maturation factor RimP n=1 Tax=Chlorobium chlorochromatii (strain CaD3) TaxID=340177 RepID=RIMP_CHLCH|nr:RecName: Full=Ribosome maturation factor RimP [Chlorobium chlorochromatii CaD3]